MTAPDADRPRRRGRAGAVRDDGGSVAVLMCFIVLIAGTLVTFVVDAGTRIDAANKADTYSAEAARAASSAIGPVPVGAAQARQVATAAARSYLVQAGVTNYVVSVTGPATVRVEVTVAETSPLLGVTVTATRQHTAQLLVGVTGGEPAG